MDQELSEEELQDLYAWLDRIPLSRPKRHITRDFSDGGRRTETTRADKQEALHACSCTLLPFNRLSVEPPLVMAAEVVKHFLPKLVDLHNYTPASSTQQKLTNWDVLNRRGSPLVLGSKRLEKARMKNAEWEKWDRLSLSRLNPPPLS